jgi:hypothetical protein
MDFTMEGRNRMKGTIDRFEEFNKIEQGKTQENLFIVWNYQVIMLHNVPVMIFRNATLYITLTFIMFQ